MTVARLSLTELPSNVFDCVVLIQIFILFRVLHDRKDDLLNDLQHVWLQNCPRVRMRNAVKNSRKKLYFVQMMMDSAQMIEYVRNFHVAQYFGQYT